MSKIEQSTQVIDTHAFLGRSSALGIPERTGGYFQSPEFAHTKFLVMPFSARSNSGTLRRVAENDKFLGMYLMFNPNEESPLSSSADSQDRIQHLMPKDHVVGLKSHPALFRIPMNDPRYFPYYDSAQKHDLPILLHAAGSGQDYNSGAMTQEILERFPDLKVILAHFGGLNPKYMEEAVKLAEDNPNLYLNTTTMHQIGRSRRVDNVSLRRSINSDKSDAEVKAVKQEVLQVFLAMCEVRPRQILFGSDMGWNKPSDYSYWPLSAVNNLTVVQLIFLDNPRSLFGKKMKKV